MSKTIYDEVLDILVDSFIDPQDEDDNCYMFDFRQMSKISKSIRKAQKQEKLLNKIKEIIDIQDDSYISSMLEESKRYYEIKKLMIKELEKWKN